MVCTTTTPSTSTCTVADFPSWALGWTYAATLGTALVYLGEHYVVDLMVGLALAETVRRGTPALLPAARALSRAVQALERGARA